MNPVTLLRAIAAAALGVGGGLAAEKGPVGRGRIVQNVESIATRLRRAVPDAACRAGASQSGSG